MEKNVSNTIINLDQHNDQTTNQNNIILDNKVSKEVLNQNKTFNPKITRSEKNLNVIIPIIEEANQNNLQINPPSAPVMTKKLYIPTDREISYILIKVRFY